MPALETRAVVPVKLRAQAKQRLSDVLSPLQRRELAAAMCLDVFDELRSTKALDGVVVVTSDPDVLVEALSRGFQVVADPGDLNSAVASGVRVIDRGCALVLPCDLPLLNRSELEDLISLGSSGAAVIVPDRGGGGTNALLYPISVPLAPSFGQGSFRRHLDIACSQGLEVLRRDYPGIGFDIDTSQDLKDLFQIAGPSRTRSWMIEMQASAAKENRQSLECAA